MDSAGQQIDYGYMPAAHTDGDLYVHLPKLICWWRVELFPRKWPLLDYKNGAWLSGSVRALQRLAGLVNPTPASCRQRPRLTGGDIVRHRDMYQKLFATMIGYLNIGLGPEDA